MRKFRWSTVLSLTALLLTTPVWSDEPPEPGKPAESLICGPGLHFDEPSGRCRRDVPLTKENRPPCKDTVTTVDGREVPYEEVKALTGRLYDELTGTSGTQVEGRVLTDEEVNRMKRIGLISVPCEGTGITVETDAPELLPKEIEGIPVIPVPMVKRQMLSHTGTSLSVFPSYGAVAVTDRPNVLSGSLTVPVLSKGRRWALLPSHLLRGTAQNGQPYCTNNPPCQLGTLLDSCPLWATGEDPLYLPPIGGVRRGQAIRWEKDLNNTVTKDLSSF